MTKFHEESFTELKVKDLVPCSSYFPNFKQDPKHYIEPPDTVASYKEMVYLEDGKLHLVVRSRIIALNCVCPATKRQGRSSKRVIFIMYIVVNAEDAAVGSKLYMTIMVMLCFLIFNIRLSPPLSLAHN